MKLAVQRTICWNLYSYVNEKEYQQNICHGTAQVFYYHESMLFSAQYTAQLDETHKATACFQARPCVFTSANLKSVCSANHLGVCFKYKVCAEAGICSIHVRNVQLAQEAAAAQQILAADIFQKSSLVCVLPQLLLH